MFSTVMRLIFLVSFVFICGGCGSNDQRIILGNAEPNAIVTGRVIDSSSRAPIVGAEVTLLCNGKKLSVTSISSNDPNLAGTFTFTGLIPTAAYSGYELSISAPGYAVYRITVTVPVSTDGMPISVTLGSIELGKACNVTVIVTDNGIPVPGVVVSASNQYSLNYGTAISSVTDVNGTAILEGLNQEATYSIMTAPKYDTNGNILYPATTPVYNYQPQNSARTVSISLIPAGRDDAIQIIGSNLLNNGPMTTSTQAIQAIKSDSIIKIVFNYPVELSGNVTATYLNDLAPSSDLDYGKVLSVATLSGSLDPTGTILTVVNSSPYIRNQSYTFDIPVIATVNGRKQAYDFSTASTFFSNPVYVTDDSSSGLSPTSTLIADNFNGTSGATATSSPAQVFVEFPEKVFGSYRVISTRNGSIVTPFSISTVYFGFSDGTMTYSSNSGGADGIVAFKLPLYYGVYLPDNRPGSPSEVTIYFDIIDAEGIRFNKTVTLPVQ
ncbi:MAG: carboxypeptidase-like regulatory domain-containing protein [Desulfobacteraceae bacterium]|nr:carboxypeptidase-like regulatory domain-containing protein [Desulfobacteraceae bacterium]